MISIKVQPSQLQPVANPIILVLDSTKKAKENYQFIVDINISGVTQGTFPFQPDPSGYGVKDIHKVIQSHISYDVTDPLTDLTEIKKATNSFVEYDVTLSEEYIPTIDITSIISDSGGARITVFTSAVHNCSVGTIVKLANVDVSTYDRTYAVVEVTDTTRIIIATPYTSNASSGDFRKSNEPTQVFTSPTVFSNRKIAFNGAEDWVDFASYNNEDFDILDYTDTRLLTSLTTFSDAAPTTLAGWKDAYEVTPNSRMYLNAWNKDEHFSFCLIGAYDSNGTLIGTVNSDVVQTGTTDDDVIRMAVGPYNINNSGNASGYGSNFLTGATYYYVQTEFSSHYLFKIVDDCSRFESYQLVFADSLGSMIPVTFNLMSSKSVSVNKTSYKKNTGSYDPITNTYGYNTYDRGKTRLNTELSEIITVNSDWVSEAQSDIINQIYSSPEVFHINQDGQMFAIDVLNTNFIPKTRLNDKLINFEVKFEYSFKNPQQ